MNNKIINGSEAKCFDEKWVAATLSVSVQTVRRWRYDGGGPDFLRLGGSIRYREADVEKWMAAQRVSSSGEAS